MHLLSFSLAAINRGIDGLGFFASWCTLFMTLGVSIIVVLRYGFHEGFIALQESITYLHAVLFMCGVAFTLQQDEHVRVDIFYRNASPRYKQWINALGDIVFLLPVCAFIFLSSIDLVADAWHIREGSAEVGGIDAVYLLKALIPIMAGSLFLQGISRTINNTLLLMNIKQADD